MTDEKIVEFAKQLEAKSEEALKAKAELATATEALEAATKEKDAHTAELKEATDKVAAFEAEREVAMVESLKVEVTDLAKKAGKEVDLKEKGSTELIEMRAELALSIAKGEIPRGREPLPGGDNKGKTTMKKKSSRANFSWLSPPKEESE